MRSKLYLTLLAMTSAIGLTELSSAQVEERIYVVTYIEVVPPQTASALELLGAYAKQGHDAKGNLQFRALQRIGRPNHFALLEAWTNAAALEAHSRSEDAERFRTSLAPLLYSPPDRREQRGLVVGMSRDPGPGAVYVLTHVDVGPPSVEQVVEYLRTLAAASRAEPDNLRFDVLVTDRKNHMTVVEAWRSAAAQEAHSGEPHNRTFRADIASALGALYDERLYRGL